LQNKYEVKRKVSGISWAMNLADYNHLLADIRQLAFLNHLQDVGGIKENRMQSLL